MKAVILAGGLGTRLSEETGLKPKPMVNIGGMPILWHIMKLYSAHNINDFIICCGYKGYVIKEFFSNYFLHMSDVTFDMKNNSLRFHNKRAEPWKVTLVDTGDNSMTGGRLKRVQSYLDDEFCFTYGDGVADINITESIKFHKSHNKLATVSAATPPGRFGAMEINEDKVISFNEKPISGPAMVNCGFFVLSKKVLDFIDDDATIWEREPLEKLSSLGELMVYKHDGFWQPMDTLRDKNYLEALWNAGNASWKIWS